MVVEPAGAVGPSVVWEGVEVGAAEGAGGEGVAGEDFGEGGEGAGVGAEGVNALRERDEDGGGAYWGCWGRCGCRCR